VLIPKELIIEAKNKMGEKAANIIAKDLDIKEFDAEKLRGLCPFHSEESGSFIWNPKENSYKCFGCGKVYGILDHYIDYNHLTFLESVEKLFKEENVKFRFGEKGVKTKREYKYPPKLLEDDRTIIEKYCLERKISKETLDYCDVQQYKGNLIWNFYDENDVLMTVKCRPPRKVGKKENKEWYLPDYDNSPILFNMNKIDPTQPLVITEGQFDTLAVIESGYKNVVSVPGGTENLKWIEECYDWLERFDKIILWSDNDKPGLNLRKEACSRLGTYRTYFVDLPQELECQDGQKYPVKDANEVLFHCGPEKVLEFIINAKEIPITNVVDLSDIPDFDMETAQGIYSGIEELDKWIYKFFFGTVVVLTGRNGNGKSVFLNQEFIAEPLNQGQDVFVFSGEMGRPVLKSWIELVLAGRENVTLKNNNIHVIKSEARNQMKDWFKGRVFVYDDDKDFSANSILNKLEMVVRKSGVKVAVLDNLLTIDLQCKQEDLWQEQQKFMVRLINFASKYNILIVLVAHPKKTAEFRRLTSDDVGGSGSLTNLCHYVLAVHRYTAKEKAGTKDGKGNYKKGCEPKKHDVVIDLFKNRLTGHANKEIELYFDYMSYRFFDIPKTLWKRYGWNKDTSPIRTDNPNLDAVVPDFIKD
jgi:twinkle protein